MRKMYELLAQRYGLKWDERKYDPNNWDGSDLLNKCVSAANACLNGITEAAVLAAGYAPAVGFIHTGKPLSFVYDIADIFKFDTCGTVAFRTAARPPQQQQPERAVRLACRDMFRKEKVLARIIPTMKDLAAGEMQLTHSRRSGSHRYP